MNPKVFFSLRIKEELIIEEHIYAAELFEAKILYNNDSMYLTTIRADLNLIRQSLHIGLFK